MKTFCLKLALSIWIFASLLGVCVVSFLTVLPIIPGGDGLAVLVDNKGMSIVLLSIATVIVNASIVVGDTLIRIRKPA